MAALRLCQAEGYKPEEAQDLTQAFFALLLERKRLERSSGEKRGGCVLICWRHSKIFYAKARRRDMDVKRGEGRPLVALEELLARERNDLEPADTLSADRIYERRWALTLLEQVLAQLGEEYRARGQTAQLFDD